MIDFVNRISSAMQATATLESTSAEVWTLLRTLFRQQRRRFLGAASELDLHPAQAGALLQLDSPLPMHELASLLGCDNSNVTGLVDRLEARDLVTRRPSADDRRVKHVVLTTGGRRLRSELLARVAAPVDDLERLSAAEQRQLRDLLRRLVGEAAEPESR
jgi:MarR family transcriptional regulator, organic hydroperoxide resistance regulator